MTRTTVSPETPYCVPPRNSSRRPVSRSRNGVGPRSPASHQPRTKSGSDHSRPGLTARPLTPLRIVTPKPTRTAVPSPLALSAPRLYPEFPMAPTGSGRPYHYRLPRVRWPSRFQTPPTAGVWLHYPTCPRRPPPLAGGGLPDSSATKLTGSLTPPSPAATGTPRPSTNQQKRTFPGRGNRAVLQGTQGNPS